MFSKSIFKQCIKGNGKLWLVFTGAAALFLIVIVCTFDPVSFSAAAAAMQDSALSKLASNMGTLLGSMETFYTAIALLLGIVYALFVANSLVVDEVDSGSMAYTLSTPIKRGSVVITKAAYLVCSIILMFVVIAGVGYATVELRWGAVSDTAITKDVRAAAQTMGKDPQYVRTHLYTIKDDAQALSDGAEAQDMDKSSYTLYLDMKMDDDAYKATAKKLTSDRFDLYDGVTGDDRPSNDEIEITKKELEANPKLALGDNDALKEGAKLKDMTLSEYRDYLQQAADANAQAKQAKSAPAQLPANPTQALVQNPSQLLQLSVDAASKAMGISASSISDNMVLLKDQKALDAAVAATGVPADQLTQVIDRSMASAALAEDSGTEFDNVAFAWLNVGGCLLVLAMSSISFFASCVFDRTKNAMMLGGGLPLAFFLLSIMVQMGDNLDDLKYLTITTLFDAKEIVAMGDFGVGLAALGAITVVLYAAGCAIFCRKDLPL